MATNKKRKLNGPAAPKNISAVAARRQLLKITENPESPQELVIGSTTEQAAVAEPQLFDGSLVDVFSNAAVRLRNGMGLGSENVTENEMPDYGNMSESPEQEDDKAELLTESMSRERNTIDSMPLSKESMSTWIYSGSNAKRFKNGSLMIKLSAGEKLVILGEYGLSVAKGQVTVLGATISVSDTIHRVYALASHSLPVIRFLASDDSQAEICIHQNKSGLHALKHLSPHYGKMCNDGLKPHGNGEDISAKKLLHPKKSSFQIVYSTADGPRGVPLQPISSPPQWNEAIATSEFWKIQQRQPSSTMICGPKSSGKSTFSRLLTNRLLSAEANKRKSTGSGRHHTRSGGVAFLDLDPGQPEYSPPGHLSLVYLSEPNLGPSYSHPTSLKGAHEIIRAHSIAAVSPAADPVLYMDCVRDLLVHYRSVLLTETMCPLIINTPGWVQGTGLEILVDIINTARPTGVIYMSEAGPLEVVKTLKDAASLIPVLTLPSQTTEFAARTAADLRTMQFISYFHVGPGKLRSLTWNSEPLTSKAPWEVRYTGRGRGIFGIMCLGEAPPPDMLRVTIDGTMLSVVVLDDMAAIRGRSDHEQEEVNDSSPIIQTKESIPYLNPTKVSSLDPVYSHTIGLALLRGIDTKRKRLQLLTPISGEDINKINDNRKAIVLVSGNLDTPGWAYREALYKEDLQAKRRRKEQETKVVKDQSDDSDKSQDDLDEDLEEGPGEKFTQVPWLERLQGDQGRGVAARVWRVRRDLGRAGDGGG